MSRPSWTCGRRKWRSLATTRLWRAISDFAKPLVATVRGFALRGGYELALRADVIVAGKSATFELPEIMLAIMPGAGAT